MDIRVFSNNDYLTGKWTGGSTTQMYIFPENTSYLERNFDVRISSAKVEVSKSTFTPLPGINRKLMVLDGEIEIHHLNQYSKTLKKFDIDEFSGDFITTAQGTCTDFNLMTNHHLKSELKHVNLQANQYKTIAVEPNFSTLCFFVYSGNIFTEIDDKLYILKKDSLMVISEAKVDSFHLHANKKSDLIIAKIG